MKQKLQYPNKAGLCFMCINPQKNGSAYCKGPHSTLEVFQDETKNFPRLEEAKKVFPIQPGVVFTYGDTIYADGEISYGLVRHELTHVRQQTSMGKDIWWDKYLVDPEFRLSQEIEAYQNQYRIYREKEPARAYIYRIAMADDLSGGLYQVEITFEEAKKLIAQ